MAKKAQIVKPPKHGPWYKRMIQAIYADRMYFPLILPGFILIFLFSYLPMPGILLAFQNRSMASTNFFVNLFNPLAWTGFSHFMAYFQSPALWLTLRNTIGYNLIFLSLGLIGGVFVAIAASELWSKRRAKLYQSIAMFPAFLSWVIISYVLFSLLSPNYGVFNSILEFFGFEPVNWYMSDIAWAFLFPFLVLWKGVGIGSIYYFAAIAGIDQEMYESATIDGATRFKQIIHITLPMLKPTMIIMTILGLGGIIRTDFGLFYVATRQMGGGMLYNSAVTIDIYTYSMLTSSGNLSVGSAVGLFQSVVGLLMIIGVNAIIRKVDRESAVF